MFGAVPLPYYVPCASAATFFPVARSSFSFLQLHQFSILPRGSFGEEYDGRTILQFHGLA